MLEMLLCASEVIVPVYLAFAVQWVFLLLFVLLVLMASFGNSEEQA